MNTRKQHTDTPTFRQDAFSSSAGFERGVVGNLVADRCQRLSEPEMIAVLWWLQQITWREGGLEKFSADFIAAHQHLIGTPAMHRLGMKPRQIYNADQVREVRSEFPRGRHDFLLKGERSMAEISSASIKAHGGFGSYEGEPDRSQSRPTSYPAATFIESCTLTPSQLANHLAKLLVDPQTKPATGLWNFPGLWPALTTARENEARTAAAQVVETAITRTIAEELDFALEAQAFVLIEGREGLGKTEGARAWCERHPGQAVYVRLESGTDETTLFRSIARQIGTACSYGLKAIEMRTRIQDALQPCQLMLVLDEGHWLWPQSDRSQRSVPKRIDWLRTAIIDYGVSVALISTPQFFKKQCDRFRKAGWNSMQVQRRLARTTALPECLSVDDVCAVASQQFPAVDAKTLKRIASHALDTMGYLTTIEHLRKRIDFLARRRPGVSERELILAELPAMAAATAAPIAPSPAAPAARAVAKPASPAARSAKPAMDAANRSNGDDALVSRAAVALHSVSQP